jgi:hypothetical protein
VADVINSKYKKKMDIEELKVYQLSINSIGKSSNESIVKEDELSYNNSLNHFIDLDDI